MKRLVIFLFLSSLPFFLLSQKIQIAVGSNYGSFSMKEVIAFQNEIFDQYPVRPKKISEFPSYFGYEGKAQYQISKFLLGFFGSFNSTGSRLSYQDYSGSFEYNQIAKLVQLGAIAEYRPCQAHKVLNFFFSLQIAPGWTNFIINNKTIIGTAVLVDQKVEFVSQHIMIQPGVGVELSFGKNFVLKSNVGYLIDDAGLLEDSNNKSFKLFNKNNKPIGVDWSGLRVGLAGGFRF
jgi:hypothetical protein